MLSCTGVTVAVWLCIEVFITKQHVSDSESSHSLKAAAPETWMLVINLDLLICFNANPLFTSCAPVGVAASGSADPSAWTRYGAASSTSLVVHGLHKLSCGSVLLRPNMNVDKPGCSSKHPRGRDAASDVRKLHGGSADSSFGQAHQKGHGARDNWRNTTKCSLLRTDQENNNWKHLTLYHINKHIKTAMNYLDYINKLSNYIFIKSPRWGMNI